MAKAKKAKVTKDTKMPIKEPKAWCDGKNGKGSCPRYDLFGESCKKSAYRKKTCDAVLPEDFDLDQDADLSAKD